MSSQKVDECKPLSNGEDNADGEEHNSSWNCGQGLPLVERPRLSPPIGQSAPPPPPIGPPLNSTTCYGRGNRLVRVSDCGHGPDEDGPGGTAAAEVLRDRQMRNFFTALFTVGTSTRPPSTSS